VNVNGTVNLGDRRRDGTRSFLDDRDRFLHHLFVDD
jgi:hypothetical protein